MSTPDAPLGPATWSRAFALPADMDSAWRALTDPGALVLWFGDHAEVELRAGGRFAFWGTRTPWTATRAKADQRITQLDADARTLALRWTWAGTPVDVVLSLASMGAQSTLTVHMTCGPQRFGYTHEAPYFMADFWRFCVGNLRAYLVSGHAAVRPDFHDQSRGVDLTVLIRAGAAKVWGALTQPAQMDLWISTKAEVDLREGGRYAYGWTFGEGSPPPPCGPTRIIEMVPEALLVTDWRYGAEPRTCVTWALEGVPGGTLLRLRHVVPTVEPIHTGYVNGWASFLVEAREFVETGVPQRV